MTWDKNTELRDKIKSARSKSLMTRVQSLIVAGIEAKNVARSADGLIHGSEAASANWCERETYYRIVDGVMPDATVGRRLAAIFDEGSESHRKWQQGSANDPEMQLSGDWLCLHCQFTAHDQVGVRQCPSCGSPAVVYDEASVYIDGVDFIGHADLEVMFADGHKEGVEIKTVSTGTVRVYAPHLLRKHTHRVDDKNIIDLQGLWSDIRTPFPAHFRQGNFYGFLRGWTHVHIWYEYKPCVPTWSRCLTRRGWTTVYDLREGDEILTYNQESHVLEWEPYQGANVFINDGEPLWSLGNAHNRFLATPNHRWSTRMRRPDRPEVTRTRTTTEINSSDWIPRTAPYHFTGESVLNEYEAEVLGWILSDGWISTRDATYTISQAKPEGVVALEQLLRTEDHSRQGPYPPRTGRTIQSNYPTHYFYLIGDLREKFRELLPDKASSLRLVTRLDGVALKGLLRGLLGGDGSWSTGTLGTQFIQNDGAVKELFQIASTLVGEPMNITRGAKGSYPSARQWMRAGKAVQTTTTSDVWCPMTTNGYWLMEQDGKVIITGNSQETRDFIMPVDPVLGQQMLDQVLQLNTHIKSKTPPPRPEDATTPSCALCKGCPAQKVCWFDDKTPNLDRSEPVDARPADRDNGGVRVVTRRSSSPIPTGLRTS